MNIRRRSFLKSVGTVVTSMTLAPSLFAHGAIFSETVRLGIITDTHIGFVDDGEERLRVFLQEMAQVSPDGLLQLGDFAYPDDRFRDIVTAFNEGAAEAVHVIGNHDLDLSLTRQDCMKAWGIPSPYYTKKIKWLRLIVLDGNETGSPTHSRHGGYPSYIGRRQQEWLARQLESADSPVLIVSHQPLAGRNAIDNHSELQELIAAHKQKVVLCMNGHSHVDQWLEIDGVTYWHCNSASYFWLGGKIRLAKYQDPLFATMTIDPIRRELRIEGVVSHWMNETPADADFFAGKNSGLEEIVVPKIRNRRADFQQEVTSRR